MSHTVVLSPSVVDLVAGGPPVVQTVTVGGVPADAVVAQSIGVDVGGVPVTVGTTVTVDNPEPIDQTVTASVAYTVTASTPTSSGGGEWVYNLTYAPA